MSAEEKPEEKPEEKKALTYEEILDALVKDSAENKKAINMMAQAIVKINEKVEALGKGGGNPQQDLFGFLKSLTEKKEGGELDAVVKGVENLARVGEALDRIRNPPRLGIGEAMLMRLGMRAAYPRYMTKAEIERIEREAGVFEALTGASSGGSTEHVKE